MAIIYMYTHVQYMYITSFRDQTSECIGSGNENINVTYMYMYLGEAEEEPQSSHCDSSYDGLIGGDQLLTGPA